MDRVVRQIYPEGNKQQATDKPRLRRFLAARHCSFGRSWAGKSHAFRELAEECRGRYLTARAFLTRPIRSTGEVLFIDGLDERRGGRGDRDTVDALAAKLIEAEPAADTHLVPRRGLARRERPHLVAAILRGSRRRDRAVT